MHWLTGLCQWCKLNCQILPQFHMVCKTNIPMQVLHRVCFYRYMQIFLHIFLQIHAAFFHKQPFFPTQPQCCLIFSWIEFQMLVRCCLIHIFIIKLRHILYLVYSCQCLGLGLFMSYLCDLFFFSPIFIVINHITSLKQTNLVFIHFLGYLQLFWDGNLGEESK